MEMGYRIKIANLPLPLNYQHIKKQIKKCLGTTAFRKLKLSGTVAYFTVDSDEAGADQAVELLNAVEYKNREIKAKRVENEIKPKEVKKIPENSTNVPPKNARQLVIPLADMPYSEQLEWKFSESDRLFKVLRGQLNHGNAFKVRNEQEVLRKVLPSPALEGYRNKCEFTVGYPDKESGPAQSVVGFVSGKMATGECRVVSADDCVNLSKNTRAIIRHFQALVRQFGEEPFDEFKRTGFWKTLTVKDFSGDCMLICCVYPHPKAEEAKKALVAYFLPTVMPETSINFNVTSIYWQEQKNASDERHYEHLAGTPYVYASLLGLSFRISPSTFFQTNSRAAAILYTTIGDLLGLPTPADAENSCIQLKEDVADEKTEDCEYLAKRQKLEIQNKIEESEESDDAGNQKSIVILDICCGAGSIGLCLMHRIRQKIETGFHPKVPFGCIGVELNVEAVRDARKNASENGFDAKRCIFIDGEAEKIFTDLQYHMPTGCTFGNSQILGILDPPRAGVPDKVVIGCRKLTQLRTLIYLSCDPKLAMKNLVDLCKPTSRKFEGEPFVIDAIQPLDMFPMTEHFEWVVKFQR